MPFAAFQKLEDITEENEQIRKELEHADMENGNLLARNRALEQDNKSLEYQYAEASSKCATLTGIENQLKEYERLLASANEEKATLQMATDELKNSGEEAVRLWQERTELLEANISSLEAQLEQQEKEATDVIAQWESRYSTLEGSGEDVIRQWKERTESLDADIASLEKELEQKDKQTTEVIATWQERCVNLESSLQQISTESSEWRDLEAKLRTEIQEATLNVESMQLQIEEKDDAIEEITKELLESRDQSEQVVKQWQERSEQLESNITELEQALLEQHNSANDAIALWEARCGTLNEKIEGLEMQIVDQDQPLIDSLEQSLTAHKVSLAEKESALSDITSDLEALRASASQKEAQMSSLETNLESALSQLEDTRNKLDRSNAEHGLLQQTLTHKEHEFHDQKKELLKEKNAEQEALEDQVSNLTTKLEAADLENEESQKHLKETKGLFSLRAKEWEEKDAYYISKIEKLELNCTELERQLADSRMSSSEHEVSLRGEFETLKEKYLALESEMAQLLLEKKEAFEECEESKVIVYQLQEELRFAKEELQSFATDQFSAKATEMATHALRHQMLEIRSQYASDQKALAIERNSRIAAEEEVKKLKSDVVLLAQATEYNENVDVQVRKVAKKIAAENDRKERKEMEELRSALERLKDELGSCRWKEREAEEKFANARLHSSILEQEVYAAKSDLALMEQAMEELENSKIDMSVSLEYRIETLENECQSIKKSDEEIIHGIKAELARSNLEKDRLCELLAF